MNLISFNICGLGNSLKITALKILLERVNSGAILLQETMTSLVQACELFLKICPSRLCCGMDVVGMSRGLLVAWNSKVDDFKPFSTTIGIIIERKFIGMERRIRILNVYGPYIERKVLWEHVTKAVILIDSSLIIVGDFNFTLPSDEV